MGGDYIPYCRKGDEQWREIPRRNVCFDMVYLGFDGFGFARDIINHPYTCPFENSGVVYRNIPQNPDIYPFEMNSMVHVKVGIRLTVSGEVLMVLRVRSGNRNLFEVYRMDEGKWKKVYSLGEEEEEALVWDLNVTLPTKSVTGIKKDEIYFCHTYKFHREVAAFSMSTQSLLPFGPPDLNLGDARWFLPSFCTAEQ